MSKTTTKFALEVRESAVRIVFERQRDHSSQWLRPCRRDVRLWWIDPRSHE